jgi:hypothetical protein
MFHLFTFSLPWLSSFLFSQRPALLHGPALQELGLREELCNKLLGGETAADLFRTAMLRLRSQRCARFGLDDARDVPQQLHHTASQLLSVFFADLHTFLSLHNACAASSSVPMAFGRNSRYSINPEMCCSQETRSAWSAGMRSLVRSWAAAKSCSATYARATVPSQLTSEMETLESIGCEMQWLSTTVCNLFA